MTTLSRCLAAVATTTCFLASPSVVYAGELGGPGDEVVDGVQADDAQDASGTDAAPAPEGPAPVELADPSGEGEGTYDGPALELTAPRLEYGDQGPSRGRGARMGDAGIALTVLGGVSLVGSTFWLMVCPSEPETATVGRGEFEEQYSIKCFDAERKVVDRSAPVDAEGNEVKVTLKAGAGNPVLPGLITMAAAGGVMLGAGIALLVINAKRNKQGVAAAPMLNRSTAGVSVTGRF